MFEYLKVAALIGVGLIVLLAIFGPAFKVVGQWERGVVLRLGKLVGTRTPGFNLILPYIDRMMKVDMRTQTWIVRDHQEVITKDNVTVHVDAVVYFNVIDPVKAVVEVADYRTATEQLALTSLRSVLGQSELDVLLSDRSSVNDRLRKIIDEHTESPWGVRVSLVEVRDVKLPVEMQRAMAKQAEAEREKRAKVIHAEGERLAAHTLKEAGDVMAQQPIALQLRYLQTLVEIADERSSTIIPLPLDLIGSVQQALGMGKARSESAPIETRNGTATGKTEASEPRHKPVPLVP